MNLEYMIDVAKRYYDFNANVRPYHSFKHAAQVANGVNKIIGKNDITLELAAWWHDAVYIPGARGDSNEQCSASALEGAGAVYLDIGSQKVVQRAAELIRNTSVEMHMWGDGRIHGDLGVLLDADLESLAAPYELFVVNQRHIISEQRGEYPRDRHISAGFLSKFLECRENIYHTDYGRDNWEAKARENIVRYSEE